MDHKRPTPVPLTAAQQKVVNAAIAEWRILGVGLGLMFALVAIISLSRADRHDVTSTEIFIAVAGGMIGGGVAGSVFGFVAGSLRARSPTQDEAPARHPLDPDPDPDSDPE